MANGSGSSTAKVIPGHQNLTPNERAIIDKIKIPLFRNLFTAVWRAKLRLQFSGWLQYIPPAVITLALFLFALIAYLVQIIPVAIPFAALCGLMFLSLCFELLTVKLRLRPHERLPKRNDNLDLFDLMRARRSCRSYQIRKLTPDHHRELMEHVKTHTEEPKMTKSPIRFEYVSAPLTVWPAVNASEFLVAIAPKEYDRLAVIEVGRSLQKIVMDAVRMGLGTCWIGPGADHESIVRYLAERFDPDQDHIICVCAIGYKSRYVPMFIRLFNAQMDHRLPLQSLFFDNPQLSQTVNLESPPYRQFGRTFEICQWAPSSYNGQTTRCAAVTEKPGDGVDGRLARFDFYSAIESRFYAPVAAGIWSANWELGCSALGKTGHFSVLSNSKRGIAKGSDEPRLPHYEFSWVPDAHA